MNRIKLTGIAAVFGVVFLTGCDNPPTAAEVGKETGATLDTAAKKTVEATKTAAEATKEFTGKMIEKTGESLKKAGSAMEKTGAEMQE